MLALLSSALLLTASAVEVHSEFCPAARDIENALEAMLPASSDAGPSDVARVFRRHKRIQIELSNREGALIGERSIDDSDRCNELAIQIAVVLASLVSDVHPEFSAPPPEPKRDASAAKTEGNRPPSTRAISSFDVAAGASMSYASSIAWGGGLAATWIPHSTGIGLRVSAGTESARSVDLGDDKQAIWRRWTVTSEADWRLGHGHTVLDVHAGLAWTLLAANGSGFPQNESQTSLAPGAEAGIRLSWWTTRHLSAWVGLEGTYWLRRQLVSPSQEVAGREIPRYSVLASLGLALGRSGVLPLGFQVPAAQ